MRVETARRIVDEVLSIADRFGRFVSIDKDKQRLMLDGGVLKDDGTLISPHELMIQAVQRIANEVDYV